MTRTTLCVAPRRARRRHASRRLQTWLRATAALALAGALLVPPPSLASKAAEGGGALAPHGFAWGLASVLEGVATVLSAGLLGRPAAGALGAAPRTVAPRLPPTRQEREAQVTQLAIAGLPLNLTPPPLDPPDQNVQVYGPLVLQQQEPINLTALPLDADGDAVHGVTPWWYSSDRSVVFVRKDGQALAGNPGTALLTAHVNTIKAVVVVTVVPNSQKYGGQKPDSTRTLPATPPLLGRRADAGVRFVNAAWSPDSARPTAARAPRARLVKAGAAAAQLTTPRTGRRRPDYEERLPDDESESLYEPRNDVGTPPHRTEPGAPTPPAAIPSAMETPGSDNFNFVVPAVGLGGRGLDIYLALTYNSRLWHRSTDRAGGAHMTYDVDAGWPAPGFRLGYGYVEAQGTNGFTLVQPGGSRHRLVKVNPFNRNDHTYETTDGTFIRFVGGRGWGAVTYPDGTRVDFGAAGDNPRSYPIKITDRNGNYVLISYRDGVGPHLSTVQDTMGRYVRFRYQGNELVSVTAPGYEGGQDRQTIRLYYEALPITGTFTADRVAPPAARVIRYVYFPGTRSGYRYDYSSYGMIYRMVDLRGMTVSTTEEEVMGAVTGEGQAAVTTEYDYPVGPALLTDAPIYTRRTDDWAGRTPFHTAGPPVHLFSSNKEQGISTVTSPDGTQTTTQTVVNRGQWDDGLVRQIEVKQGGKIYRRTVNTWEHDGASRNPRPRRVDVVDERNEMRSTLYSYAAFNNVSLLTELGYGGEELRRIQTAYETRPEYINRRLIHLPVSVSIFDGRTGVQKSLVEYTYDGSGDGLVPRPDIIMHDPASRPQSLVEDECRWEPDPNDPDTFGCEGGGTCDGVVSDRYVCSPRSQHRPETNYRGNPTQMTTYTRATDPSPETAIVYSYAYDVAGNLLRETADCCQQKSYTFEKAYEYAYPTVSAQGDAEQLKTRSLYDFNTGLVRRVTDPNEQASVIDYYPDSLRHLQTTRPDAGYTRTVYGDEAMSFVRDETLVDRKGDLEQVMTSLRRFNGRSEMVRSAVSTPDGWAIVDVAYDEMRRLRRTSNPYYAADPFGANVNPSGAETTYAYDALGRRTEMRMADNTVARTDFDGRVTTVTDQEGRQRRMLTDALGRTERVDEPDASGNLGPVGSPVQATSYAHDVLNNLVRVTQGAQQRFWRYDSAGRLTHERQPEQDAPISAPDPESDNVTHWSRRYEYTPRGEVKLIQDARGITTTFTYDGLNRIKQITYSDATPAVTYTYDQPRERFFNLGRLTRVETAGAAAPPGVPVTAQEFDYDQMGRVSTQRQWVDRALYEMNYSYNSIGQTESLRYPSGRIVVYDYDTAARMTSAIALPSRIYAQNIRYAAHGAPTSEQYGNGTTHSMGYNRRLQPSAITLAKGAAVLQHYAYAYGRVDMNTGAVDETKNAGQIGRIEDYVGGTGAAHKRNDQRFLYDSLGRLDLAAERNAGDGALNWRLDYSYDRYGNRLQSAQPGHQNFNIGYFAVEPGEVNPATNRLQFAANNFEYDGAGNVRTDPRFRGLRYDYDGGGRMTRTTNLDGGAETTSVYDGLGQRVINTASGESHHFVYNTAGQVIAEYGPNGWERDRVYRGGRLLATEEAVGTCRKTVGQFVEAFYRGALDRPPTAAEAADRTTRLRTAQSQGQSALLAEARALGRALFESAEYAARARTDQEFVADLYWGYLQRAPDAGGFLFWLDYVRVNGRAATITAFGASIEFGANVENLCETNEVTGQTHWLLLDHLGSVRVVTDASGAVIGRRDNLPFGQPVLDVGLADDTGQGQGPSALGAETAGPTGLWTWHNAVRPIYAGMEKDVGTGLDHTLFRKYESAFGRWTSPDPLAGSMSVADPQSFNRYAYVRNDPVNYIDPLGLLMALCTETTTWNERTATLTVRTSCMIIDDGGGFRGGAIIPRDPIGGGFRGGGGPGPGAGPGNQGNTGQDASQNTTAQAETDCNFPSYDKLSPAQKALLGKNGEQTYNSLHEALKANFLNITGAMTKAGINFSGASLQYAGIRTDRLMFNPGPGLADMRASVQAGINRGTFKKDTPANSEHPLMSEFGARQNATELSLQVGFGPVGAFADIDLGGWGVDVVGSLIHIGEVATPGSTDPFHVGRELGSGVTGYTCPQGKKL
ncbi:MAG TPA: RHS repeat-associated core domain-containing protein [Pyrinomonadaceae bacterium]|nr:RHS repeat-associated core domain-containing protein [Pyrinomonadaceae bacterium]